MQEQRKGKTENTKHRTGKLLLEIKRWEKKKRKKTWLSCHLNNTGK